MPLLWREQNKIIIAVEVALCDNFGQKEMDYINQMITIFLLISSTLLVVILDLVILCQFDHIHQNENITNDFINEGLDSTKYVNFYVSTEKKKNIRKMEQKLNIFGGIHQ